MKTLPADQLDTLIAQGHFVLDVRNPDERQNDGFIEGTVAIPLPILGQEVAKLPKDKEIYIHCRSGKRSATACALLQEMGYSCTNIEGGYIAYCQHKGGQTPATQCKI